MTKVKRNRKIYTDIPANLLLSVLDTLLKSDRNWVSTWSRITIEMPRGRRITGRSIRWLFRDSHHAPFCERMEEAFPDCNNRSIRYEIPEIYWFLKVWLHGNWANPRHTERVIQFEFLAFIRKWNLCFSVYVSTGDLKKSWLWFWISETFYPRHMF